jgi:uncharacterized protein YjlB
LAIRIVESEGEDAMLPEVIKKKVEEVTGWGRPELSRVRAAVRPRMAHTFKFSDNGLIPNNPALPVILYRSPVRLPVGVDPAAVFEVLFESHGWSNGWRDGIYDFEHYHSRTHEVLGIARGTAIVEFGGANGRKIDIKAGDVVVLPAGTGHRRLSQSDDLLVVGAYPTGGEYDELRPSREDHDRAVESIYTVPAPNEDPVYGRSGSVVALWANVRASGPK